MNSSGSLPVIFVAHGGGPMPLLGQQPEIGAHFKQLPSLIKTPPKAILVVSAHWEEDTPAVMVGKNPPLYFDYGGFPPESYKYKYPCGGAVETAQRVKSLLEGVGFKVKEDAKRGYDHGTFVPLLMAWPNAEIPVTQVSLVSSLDPATHVRMGEALRSLRNEGVLIIGSGMTFHNMAAFFSRTSSTDGERSKQFDQYLQDACTNPSYTKADKEGAVSTRNAMLINWKKAPHATYCHPREEHLIPLLVCAGAAGEDAGRSILQYSMNGGIWLSAFIFGE